MPVSRGTQYLKCCFAWPTTSGVGPVQWTGMTIQAGDFDALRAFGASGARAVLVTWRKDGGLQSSPMSIAVDDDGSVLTATRARNAKVHNLVRDPRATLCLFDDKWPGPWMHIDGRAEI